ncbi:unnamed protein product, partial [Mesorhabditis spiculigera]
MSATEEEPERMASRVAGVTLESDSLPESAVGKRVRRRRKTRPKQMEVDPPVPLGPPREPRRLQDHGDGSQMDWQVEESDICSTDSGSPRNHDADDEQSDWVGYAGNEMEEADVAGPSSASERRRRSGKPSTAMSVIQSKLEKFSKDPASTELTIDLRAKERTQTAQPLPATLQIGNCPAATRYDHPTQAPTYTSYHRSHID